MAKINLMHGKPTSKKPKTIGGKIDSTPKPETTTKRKELVAEKKLFDAFSEDTVKREGKISSVCVKLWELEEFEHNARLIFDGEEIDRLADSIKKRWLIDEIDVYHIIKGDRYIISDGHRTRRALIKLYWWDHKVEVIVRKEIPELTGEIKKEIMEVCFVTSTLKVWLTIYEQLESITAYLKMLDEIDTESAPHHINQKTIYTQLGYSKSKADKYEKIIKNVPQKYFKTLKQEEVSYNLLVTLSQLADEDRIGEAVSVLKEQKISTPQELKEYTHIREKINEDLPKDLDNRSDIVKNAATERLIKNRKEKENAQYSGVDDSYIYNIEKKVNNLRTMVWNIDFENCSEDKKSKLLWSVKEVYDYIKRSV